MSSATPFVILQDAQARQQVHPHYPHETFGAANKLEVNLPYRTQTRLSPVR
jgi:hypothetical protein